MTSSSEKTGLMSKIRSTLEQKKKYGAKLVDIDNDLYQNVYDNKTLLKGKEDEEGIDWSHFDFMLSIPHAFDHCNTYVDVLRAFWKNFYPHLSTFMNEYDFICQRFDELCLEADEVVRNHGEGILEAKILEAFFDKEHPELHEEYKRFKTKLEEQWEEERKASGIKFQEESNDGTQEA